VVTNTGPNGQTGKFLMRKTWDNIDTLNSYLIEPEEIKDGDKYGYKIIAWVFKAFNGWCAFSGPTSWSDEQVANYGNEISENVANLLFPTLAGSGRVYGNF
jgi:hypothetical protein